MRMCRESGFSLFLFLRSAPILYLSCAFLSICVVSRLLDPPVHAKLPNWQLDWNPQHTSAHAYSFPFPWTVMRLSLEWSYFERTTARTITSLAGDGQCGVATKEEKTLSLRVWVLNVRTAGKLGRVRFCLLSTITQLQGVTYSTCHDHLLSHGTGCLEHAREGGQQCSGIVWGRSVFLQQSSLHPTGWEETYSRLCPEPCSYLLK